MPCTFPGVWVDIVYLGKADQGTTAGLEQQHQEEMENQFQSTQEEGSLLTCVCVCMCHVHAHVVEVLCVA